MKLLWIFIYPHLIESTNPIEDVYFSDIYKQFMLLFSLLR